MQKGTSTYLVSPLLVLCKFWEKKKQFKKKKQSLILEGHNGELVIGEKGGKGILNSASSSY